MSDRSLFEFVEMESFTRSRVGVLTDEDLTRVVAELLDDPAAGDRIPDTRGVRKIRVARGGKGKRGGARVLYFYYLHRETIYLLYAYAKSDLKVITPEDKKFLWALVAQILEG